jgi:hypothetical protein
MQTNSPLAGALRKLLQELESRTNLGRPVTIYIAGGMAAHLYTQARATTDVDAEFPARFVIPPDLTAKIEAGPQAGEILYIDTNYNPTFSLLHEHYQQDAQPLDLGLKMINVRVLAPVDLVLSKLTRLAAPDIEDIEAILRAGLVSVDQLERRGEEAIAGYVGDVARVRGNLAAVLRQARVIEANPRDTGMPK